MLHQLTIVALAVGDLVICPDKAIGTIEKIDGFRAEVKKFSSRDFEDWANSETYLDAVNEPDFCPYGLFDVSKEGCTFQLDELYPADLPKYTQSF